MEELPAEDELFVSPKDRILFHNIDATLTDYYMSLEATFRDTLDHELADGFISIVEYQEKLRAYHYGLFGEHDLPD